MKICFKQCFTEYAPNCWLFTPKNVVVDSIVIDACKNSIWPSTTTFEIALKFVNKIFVHPNWLTCSCRDFIKLNKCPHVVALAHHLSVNGNPNFSRVPIEFVNVPLVARGVAGRRAKNQLALVRNVSPPRPFSEFWNPNEVPATSNDHFLSQPVYQNEVPTFDYQFWPQPENQNEAPAISNDQFLSQPVYQNEVPVTSNGFLEVPSPSLDESMANLSLVDSPEKNEAPEVVNPPIPVKRGRGRPRGSRGTRAATTVPIRRGPGRPRGSRGRRAGNH